MYVLHNLHHSTVNVDQYVRRPIPPEVNHQLFHFINIQNQVVVLAPFCEECHLLPITALITALDKAHHCCVISIFNNMIIVEFCSAVIGHKVVQQRAQDTHLG